MQRARYFWNLRNRRNKVSVRDDKSKKATVSAKHANGMPLANTNENNNMIGQQQVTFVTWCRSCHVKVLFFQSDQSSHDLIWIILLSATPVKF